VQAASDEVTPEMSSWLLYANCQPQHAAAVRDIVLAELGRVSILGFAPFEVKDHIDNVLRQLDDPLAGGSYALLAARRHLFGVAPYSHAMRVTELQGLTPLQLQEALDEFMHQALLLVPNGVNVPDQRYQRIPTTSTWCAEGQSFHALKHHSEGAPTLLIVGHDALSIVLKPGCHISCRATDIVGYLRFTDGGRTVLTTDGFTLTVHPEDYAGSTLAIGSIDRFVSPNVTVTMRKPLRGEAGPEPAPIAKGPPNGGILDRLRA
jgi:hypothetical protein